MVISRGSSSWCLGEVPSWCALRCVTAWGQNKCQSVTWSVCVLFCSSEGEGKRCLQERGLQHSCPEVHWWPAEAEGCAGAVHQQSTGQCRSCWRADQNTALCVLLVAQGLKRMVLLPVGVSQKVMGVAWLRGLEKGLLWLYFRPTWRCMNTEKPLVTVSGR